MQVGLQRMAVKGSVTSSRDCMQTCSAVASKIILNKLGRAVSHFLQVLCGHLLLCYMQVGLQRMAVKGSVTSSRDCMQTCSAVASKIILNKLGRAVSHFLQGLYHDP